MKHFQYIIIAFVCAVFASCMGNDFDEPALTESPWGNNAIEETNVMTIADLKMRYANTIGGNMMEEVKDDIKIKGIVTGNDVAGNIYNEIAIQDETGAILVCIAQGGLFGYLPVGQEILIDLKGLMIGGYGQQAEIGGVYTNSSTGAQSIGRMSRFLWADHYKLLGTPDPSKVVPEVFDKDLMDDAQYMNLNAGKLMTIKGVTLKDADGQNVFAPTDGSVTLTANCANREFSGIPSSEMVLRTSSYADFANVPLPEGELDITGIFTRYRSTWQVLIRDENDIKPHEETDNVIFREDFKDDSYKQTGTFTTYDVYLPEELTYVWGFDARYGAKASAFMNDQKFASQSWLISQAIDLSNVRSATLTFNHACNKFGGEPQAECYVMISTTYVDGNPYMQLITPNDQQGQIIEGQTGQDIFILNPLQLPDWHQLEISAWPAGNSWTFTNGATADLTPYCGNSAVRIAFVYTSTENSAGTWEINTVRVE